MGDGCRIRAVLNDIGVAASDRGLPDETSSTHLKVESEMGKMLVIYKKPTDPVSFDEHYFGVHVPLAKRLPGLRRYEVSKGPVKLFTPGDTPYLVATLYFDSVADIRKAFASEAGKACGADRRVFAPNDDDCAMLLYDETAL